MELQRYEYKMEFIPKYFVFKNKQYLCLEEECLKLAGEEGWILCCISAPDSDGVRIFYFRRPIYSESI